MSKRPRKRKPAQRTPRKCLYTDPAITYWQPIRYALYAQAPHPSIATVSTDPVSEELKAALAVPLDEAVQNFRSGNATFSNFWTLIYTIHFLAYAVHYTLNEEKYRMAEDEETLFRLKYLTEFDDLRHQYPEVLDAIGKREQRTGKYGITGDELKALERLQEMLQNFLKWCSLRTCYYAITEAADDVADAEHRASRKPAK